MKQQFLIKTESIKRNAIHAIEMIKPDLDRFYVITISEKTRSNEQNAKLWAMLTDISKQIIWYGKKLNQKSWKNMFTAVLKEQEVVPGIYSGFVVLGQSTSDMKVSEFRDLIELIYAFGAERGVIWSEDSIIAKRWAEQAR